MRFPPLPNAVMMALLCALAGVQIALVLEFWSSFAGDDPFFKFVFQVLGVCFAGIELVALVVCADAARKGAWARAGVFRLVFVGLFVVNLASDIGAIYTYTTRDADTRAAAFQRSQTTEQETIEARERIAALHAALAHQELDLPVSALEIRYNAAVDLRDQGGVGPRTQNWRDQRAAVLEAALATAREIESLQGTLNTGRQSLADRPQSSSHPQTAALGTILAWAGFTTEEANIRTALALGMAVVLRCVLAFGFWAASPVGEGEPPADYRPRRRRPLVSWLPTIRLTREKPESVDAPPVAKPQTAQTPKRPEPVPAPMPETLPSNVIPFVPRLRRPEPEAERPVERAPEPTPPSVTPPVKPSRGRPPRKDPDKPRRDADLIDALNDLEDEFRPRD